MIIVPCGMITGFEYRSTSKFFQIFVKKNLPILICIYSWPVYIYIPFMLCIIFMWLGRIAETIYSATNTLWIFTAQNITYIEQFYEVVTSGELWISEYSLGRTYTSWGSTASSPPSPVLAPSSSSPASSPASGPSVSPGCPAPSVNNTK